MDAGTDESTAYFDRVDVDRYRPTVHAGGAWNPGEIHFSPLGGLIVHAIDRHRANRLGVGGSVGDDDAGGAAKQLARISFDILGYLASEEIRIEVTTIRPGRAIELLEATAHIAGRPAVVARAWFLESRNTAAVEGGSADALAAPDGLAHWPMVESWAGGYVASLDVRAVGEPRPGRAAAWLGTHLDLVSDEPASSTAMFIALVDTANGIAVREKPSEWLFPNVDLTIHLYRTPSGPWTGLDTTAVFGPTGVGLTDSVLHDEAGAVGRAEQILAVRPARR